MKCKHVTELASWYVSGELPAAKKAAVEAHLAGCETCRAEVQAMTRAIRALEQPKRAFDPPDVLAAVKREVVKPSPFFRPAFAGWTLAGTAAVVLAVWLATSWSSFVHSPDANQVIVQSPSGVGSPVSGPPDVPTTPDAEVPPDTVATAPKAALPGKSSPPVYRPKKTVPRPSPGPPGPSPAPEVPEPSIEYVVVYMPEDVEAARAGTSSHVASSGAGAGGLLSGSYSIRMVDEESGEITTLSVSRHVEPGSEPVVTIGYGVTNTESDGNDERSFLDEDMPLPDSNVIGSSIG